MNQPRRREGAPVAHPEEKGIGREVASPVTPEGPPGQEVKPQPIVTGTPEAAEVVHPAVEPAVAPTKINVATPAATTIDLEAVSERGPNDSEGASALVRGLNAGLEKGPEEGKGRE